MVMNDGILARVISGALRIVLASVTVLLGFVIVAPPTAVATEAVSVPPEGNRVVQHHVLVDGSRNLAIFDLWFAAPPKFFELDEHGHQQFGFQCFVRALAHADFARRRHTGERVPPLRPMLVVSGYEIHPDAKVVVREANPLNGGDGPWGAVIAEASFRQDGERVRFSVPMSVFDH